MNWLTLIIACVRAVGALAKWADNAQLLEAGGAQKIAEILRAQADDLHKIQDAMATAGKRFDDSHGLPTDIKFRD